MGSPSTNSSNKFSTTPHSASSTSTPPTTASEISPATNSAKADSMRSTNIFAGKTKRGGLVSASLPALRSQRLDLGQPAVHSHFGAGHERSIRRRQERNRSRNLRRLADSLHRHFGHHVPDELVDLFFRQTGARKSFRRLNRARAYRIYANSAFGQFRGQGARKRTQRRLCRRVHRTIHQADFARHGRIDNDRSAVIQQRQRFLDREIHAFRIDVEEFVVQAFRSRRQRREL